LCFVFLSEVVDASTLPSEIPIGGLFVVEWSSSYWERYIAAAAQAAVEIINERNFLQGSRLKLYIADMSVTRSMSPNSLISSSDFDMLVETSMVNAIDFTHIPKFASLIGPGYSSEADRLSPWLYQEDLLSVLVSATSPQFSDRVQFPDYAKICPPDSYQGWAIADLMQTLKFKSCQILSCADVYCAGLTGVFIQHATAMNIRFTKNVWSYVDQSAVEANLQEIVADCVASSVFVLLMTDVQAKVVFSAAKNLNLLGRLVWIGSEGVSSLLPSELPGNYIGLRMAWNQSSQSLQDLKSWWSLRPIQFTSSEFGNVSMPDESMWRSYSYLPLAYDAVFALAYAFKAMIQRNESVYNTSALKQALLDVKFEGASGFISFNSDLGPEIGRYDVIYQSNSRNFSFVGKWTSTGGFSTLENLHLVRDGALGVCQGIALGGMFVVNWNPGYKDEDAAAAARIATIMINQDPTLLPGINLSMFIGDTSAVRAISQNGFLSANQYNIVMQDALSAIADELHSEGVRAVVGPGFSSESIRALPALENLGMFEMSFSATSAALSNKQLYPNFARTCPPDNLQGKAIADVLAHFGWKKCQLIGCVDVYCTGLAQTFLQRCKELNIEVEQIHFWEFNNPSGTQALIKTIYENCSDSRLFVLAMHDHDALEIFQAADTIGASGNVVWMGSESVTSISSGLPYGYLGMKIGFNDTNPIFKRLQAFWDSLNPAEFPGADKLLTNPYLVLSYDATFALARAFDAMIRNGISIFNLSAIVETIKDLSFDGASGKVSFDSSLNPSFGIYDLVNQKANETVSIARWEAGSITHLVMADTPTETWFDVAVTWPGPSGKNTIPVCASAAQSSQLLLKLLLSICLSLLFVFFVTMFLWCYFCRPARTDDEDVEVIKMVNKIRQQLKMTIKDGFLTSREAHTRRYRLSKGRMKVIDYRYLVNAAKFTLIRDFEIKHMNAFCNWLRNQASVSVPFVESKRRLSLGVQQSLQDITTAGLRLATVEQERYHRLGWFIIETCETMLSPGNMSYDESIEESDEFEARFVYFLEKSAKINIWNDDDLNLFGKLKVAIAKHMAILGQNCQERFDEMKAEKAGDALISFRDSQEPPRRYSPYKQSDKEVLAIRLHEEDTRDASYQDEIKMVQISPTGIRVHSEEVFVAQLHLRAKLVNHAFQKKVLQVIQSHESLSGRESLDKESQGASEELIPSSSDQSTFCADFEEYGGDLLQRKISVDCKFDDGVRRVEISFAPVKSKARISQKLFKYADPHLHCVWPYSGYILDPVRLSVIVDGPKKILEVFKWFDDLDASSGISVCRVKNKFMPSESQDGYRDLTICVLFTTTCGMRIIGEIQVHDRKIHQLKLKMHKLYRILRAESVRDI